MKVSHALVIILGVSIVLSAAPAHAQNPDNLIVRGQSIGRVALQMEGSELLAALGPPDKAEHYEGDDWTEYVYSQRGLVITVGSRTRRIYSVWTDDTRYATADGIHVGSSDLELEVAWGQPKWKSLKKYPPQTGGDIWFYCYKPGDQFRVRATDGRIATIEIGGCSPLKGK